MIKINYFFIAVRVNTKRNIKKKSAIIRNAFQIGIV